MLFLPLHVLGYVQVLPSESLDLKVLVLVFRGWRFDMVPNTSEKSSNGSEVTSTCSCGGGNRNSRLVVATDLVKGDVANVEVLG